MTLKNNASVNKLATEGTARAASHQTLGRLQLGIQPEAPVSKGNKISILLDILDEVLDLLEEDGF
eukprot:CAMPEP_0176134392 /NCGR_PEP_ID=MMETSP0120_2-20121206/68153_1 /TAXON_ID=160619 /ORGANISM="Kryptoperidinium foliaceum, Strain CCMP 1326" /LENGTH=64 /DNA_ID=CAMNT_0017470039 /DNA_START=84 /DNA_END=278 /DNA_ORIENTATION=+